MEAVSPGTAHIKHLQRDGGFNPIDVRGARHQGTRKYTFTDQIAQLICEFYLSGAGNKTRPGIRVLAKRVGIPHWALKKRARELGALHARRSRSGVSPNWRSLRASRGTARGEQQNGDIYLIHEKDIRGFVLDHPSDIDLRKVDQLWFLDMLTNGPARTA